MIASRKRRRKANNSDGRKTLESDLIYDIGFHVGQDTDFYLKKGFRVVAVDANPQLIEDGRKKFAAPLRSGQLTLLWVGLGAETATLPFYLNKGQSEWSSFDPAIGKTRGPYEVISVPVVTLASIIKAHGVPYYLKVDTEGLDGVILQSLRDFTDRPDFVSGENGQPSMLQEMVDLGYTRFKFINQANVQKMTLPQPPREGKFIDFRFVMGSSGPFGEETIGSWKSSSQVLEEISAYWDNPNRDANIHGWYDLHGAK